MNNDFQPGYDAVIPADVRYDKSLPPMARLLYGEIRSLCRKEGYCWATNEYFVSEYDVDARTIRRWIEQLQDAGHVRVEIVDGNDRRIYITTQKTDVRKEDKNVLGGGQKCPPTPPHSIYIKEYSKESEISDVVIEECDEDGNPIRRRKPKALPKRASASWGEPKKHYDPAWVDRYEKVLKELEAIRGKQFMNRVRQYEHLDTARRSEIEPGAIIERAREMANDKFWAEKGFDVQSIVNNLDKR